MKPLETPSDTSKLDEYAEKFPENTDSQSGVYGGVMKVVKGVAIGAAALGVIGTTELKAQKTQDTLDNNTVTTTTNPEVQGQRSPNLLTFDLKEHDPAMHQCIVDWGVHYKGHYTSNDYSKVLEFILRHKNSPEGTRFIQYAIRQINNEIMNHNHPVGEDGKENNGVIIDLLSPDIDTAEEIEAHLRMKIEEKNKKILSDLLLRTLVEGDILKRRNNRDALVTYLNDHHISEEQLENSFPTGDDFKFKDIDRALNEGGLNLKFNKKAQTWYTPIQ